MLLEEARTTTDQQLAQLNKLDDEAVRTVRMALVLSGLLVGGTKFLSLPDFGLLGLLGTLSLVGSLVTSLFVYGTSSIFIGPTPDELSVEYERLADAENAYVEVMSRYESGLVRNRRLLGSNALVFAISRLLLGSAVVLFAAGLAFHLLGSSFDGPLLYEHLSIVEINT